MARNAVQFQKELSEPEFDRHYGTEEQCRAVVISARWPDGFWCPACGGREHSMVTTRDLFQCTACRRQTSPIAGTIFASTKLPLRTWFRATYHLTQSKQGISSIELGRRLRRDADNGVDGKAQAEASHAGARCHEAADRAGRDRRRLSRRRTLGRQLEPAYGDAGRAAAGERRRWC